MHDDLINELSPSALAAVAVDLAERSPETAETARKQLIALVGEEEARRMLAVAAVRPV